MAKYSSPNVLFEIARSDGGALTTSFTQYITKFGEINVARPLIESTPFGAAIAQFLVSIFKKYEPFTIEGYYDDTATTGPDAVLNIGKYTNAAYRQFSLTLGGSKTITGDGVASTGGGIWIVSYKRTFNVGEYHGYSCELQATGTIVEN
jgi:hypothetical protein